MKKGDLSMGVIIGATIALLILVIISVLIFRTGGFLTKGTSCESLNDQAFCIDQGEKCSEYTDDDGNPMKSHYGSACPNEGICCIPI